MAVKNILIPVAAGLLLIGFSYFLYNLIYYGLLFVVTSTLILGGP